MRFLFVFFVLISGLDLFAQTNTVDPDCEWMNSVTFSGSCYENVYDDYALILYDEFNAPNLNLDLWSYTAMTANGNCNDANTYFNNPGNVQISNGVLNLWLKSDQQILSCAPWDANAPLHYFWYSGGWVESAMQYGYGKFEVKFKVPYIDYINPAFWLYGSCQNEIDVFEFMEYNNALNNRRIKHTMFSSGGYCEEIWANGNSGRKCELSSHYTAPVSNEFNSVWHTASVEWTPNHISYLIDGTESVRFTAYQDIIAYPTANWECSTGSPTTILSRLKSYPNYMMFQNLPDPYFGAMKLILDIMQNGNNVPSSANLPAKFEIEYVKVWSPIVCNQTLNLSGTFGNPYGNNAKHDYVAANINCSANNSGMYIPNQVAAWHYNKIVLVASNEISFSPGFSCEQGAYMSSEISPCDYIKTNRVAQGADSVKSITHNGTSAVRSIVAKDEALRIYKVYPNPTSEKFSITRLSDFIGNNMHIYNMFGQKVFDVPIVTGSEEVSLKQFPPGLYDIRIDGLNYALVISKND